MAARANRGALFLVTAAAAIVAGAAWYASRRGPERVCTVAESATPVAVVAGHLLTEEQGAGNSLTVRAYSSNSRPAHTLFSVVTPGSERTPHGTQIRFVAASSQGTYWLEERPIPPFASAPRWFGGMNPHRPTPPLRRIARLTYATYLRQHNIHLPQYPASLSRYRVLFLPITGGAPRGLPCALSGVRPSGLRVTLDEDRVYWIDGPQDGHPAAVDVWKDAAGAEFQQFGPLVPRGVVMCAPLSGGAAAVLAVGVLHTGRLLALGGGVAWDVFERTAPLPPGVYVRHASIDLAFRRPGEPARVLRQAGSLLFCVMLGGKLYGVRPPWQEDNGGAAAHLVSGGLDGGGLREVPLPVPPYSEVTGLYAHRGRLFATVKGPGKDGNAATRLVWLELERDLEAKLVCQLPITSRFLAFDDDYCYYTGTESQENWFDWSARGLAAQYRTALYRARLPH